MLTVLLVINTLLTGLLAGFLLAMTSVVQGALHTVDAPTYRATMGGIIRVGRASVVVKVILLTPLVTGLVLLLLVPFGSGAFWLVLVGWLALVAGPLAVSRWRCEPLYDRVLSWTPDTLPADWSRERDLWFRYNLLRTGGALVAFGCYVVIWQGV